MHSDVVNHAAAHAVGEARRAESTPARRGRGRLTRLSLRRERDVLRVSSLGSGTVAGFNSSI